MMLFTTPAAASGDVCMFMPRPHLLRTQQHGTQTSRHKLQLTCMAAPRRQAKVAREIERQISTLLSRDMVVQRAMAPGVSSGDPALSALATVNEVDVSSDLMVAKVYLSIMSDEEGKATAMSGLKRLQGYVRTQVASNMNLRFAPEVRFMYDENADYMAKLSKELDKIRAEREGRELSEASNAETVTLIPAPNEEPELTNTAMQEPYETPENRDSFLFPGEQDDMMEQESTTTADQRPKKRFTRKTSSTRTRRRT